MRSGSRTFGLDDPNEFFLAMEENAIGLFGFLSRGLLGFRVKRGKNSPRTSRDCPIPPSTR